VCHGRDFFGHFLRAFQAAAAPSSWFFLDPLEGLRYPMPMPHQTDTIIWIPISEKLPPSELVLASTKNSVHILQYHTGKEKGTDSAFWMAGGKESDIRFEDIIAWAELPRPFFCFG